MNRSDSKKIAEGITNEQLQDMLNNAKVSIRDWTKVSIVNKGMTKGSAWNILGKNFNVNSIYHIMAKINMIREFGDFLSENLKPKKKNKVNNFIPFHQEPEF